MVVCIHRPTGKLVEAQSCPTPGTLISNNRAYYPEEEMEEREATQEEFEALLLAANPAPPALDPVDKLKAFLAANPDVAELLN